MSDVGRSTLLSKSGRLVGFGYMKHPIRPKWSLHIVFYWVEPDEIVICMGDVRGPRRPETMRPHLGTMVSGRDFAPYAQRQAKGLPDWKQWKEIAAKGWPNVRFEWWEEKDGK